MSLTQIYLNKSECCPVMSLPFENCHILYKGQCENTFYNMSKHGIVFNDAHASANIENIQIRTTLTEY